MTIKRQLEEAMAEITRLKKLSRCHREPNKSTLGGIIQALREERGLSLREAANSAGMSPSILSRIECDTIKANPTLSNLLRLKNVTGVPLSKIIAIWEDANL